MLQNWPQSKFHSYHLQCTLNNYNYDNTLNKSINKAHIYVSVDFFACEYDSYSCNLKRKLNNFIITLHLKIKRTIFAATPPAPAAPTRKYLTLATRNTARNMWVVNIRSLYIFLLMSIRVTPGNIPCGVLENVLMFLCLRNNKLWIWHLWKMGLELAE